MSMKKRVFLPSVLAMAISSTLSATEVFDLKVSYLIRSIASLTREKRALKITFVI
jgi:hypothetical protein